MPKLTNDTDLVANLQRVKNALLERTEGNHTDPHDLVKVPFRLRRHEHKRLRIHCAQEGVSVNAFVRVLLGPVIDRD